METISINNFGMKSFVTITVMLRLMEVVEVLVEVMELLEVIGRIGSVEVT